MSKTRDNFYILTGGPGSGKTAIINELKKRGYLCVDEVARQIIQEQTRMNGDALHTKNQIKFRDLMLSRSMQTFEQVSEDERPVFFDRGIPELIGYSHLINAAVPIDLMNACQLYRYNACVFITPPWLEIYEHDAERKQSWQEAVSTYEHVAAAYIEAGYQLIEVPRISLPERVDFILAKVRDCF